MQEWVRCGRAGDVELCLVEPNYEGVRIQFHREGIRNTEELSGWCLLRKSLHDPIMPLNIEVTQGSCAEILEIVKEFLGNYDKLKL